MEQKARWLEPNMVVPIASAVRKQEVGTSNLLPTTNFHHLNVP